jgi:hypothetical protein
LLRISDLTYYSSEMSVTAAPAMCTKSAVASRSDSLCEPGLDHDRLLGGDLWVDYDGIAPGAAQGAGRLQALPVESR